jgi:hypothetical protein
LCVGCHSSKSELRSGPRLCGQCHKKRGTV